MATGGITGIALPEIFRGLCCSLVYKCGKCVELLHDSWKKLRDDLDECVSKGGSRGIGKEAAAKFADRAAKLAEVE